MGILQCCRFPWTVHAARGSLFIQQPRKGSSLGGTPRTQCLTKLNLGGILPSSVNTPSRATDISSYPIKESHGTVSYCGSEMPLGKARHPCVLPGVLRIQKRPLRPFSCCHNRIPDTGKLKTKMYWLVVLKSGKSKIEERATSGAIFLYHP